MGRYFGTDGIRGAVGDFLNEDLAFRLGRSLRTLSCRTVLIGRDTRESGPQLAAAVTRGAIEAGLDVIDLGVVPTPLLSYACGRLDAIGVMITASHNPFTDNGLKVFLKGKKLFESEEGALEDDIAGIRSVPAPVRPGHILPAIDATGMYDELVRPVIVASRLRIAIDCANGATYRIAPRCFAETGAEIIVFGVTPDGRNINLGVGSTHIEHLQKHVVSEHCDAGFAFDGDGDRLIAVGKNGEIYDGDMLVYVVAVALEKRGLLNQRTVALTKMSNLGLVKALARHGITTVQTDVGDKFVLEALEKNDYTLGGENSGHIIDRHLLNT
ncbi:MAG: phosphoglucosamine mutase, partial [Bacillota bacterium]|nr:phosphoglucosamine mutase [Bacillota bacterium]